MDSKQFDNNVLPSISIGVPVYNGSEFLEKRLDSILSQTYQNFEIIISDNASTDSTNCICRKYFDKYERIRYVCQKKNMGMTWNWNFVLQEAKYDYFVWAGADDIWKPQFLEKNLEVLIKNKNVVCSISKSQFYHTQNSPQSEKINNKFNNFLLKLKYLIRPVENVSLIGSYEKKIRQIFTKSQLDPIYGVYRTDVLRKSFVNKSFVGNDLPILLNAVKYGDYNVIDEVLLLKYDSGSSKKGIISLSRFHKHGPLGIIFPMYPITSWCVKHLGLKLFLKNFDYFVMLNVWGGFSLFVDLIRILVQLPKFKNPNDVISLRK